MNRLISFFSRPYEPAELGLDSERPRPPPPERQSEPEYFVQLLKYLREQNARQGAEEPASEQTVDAR